MDTPRRSKLAALIVLAGVAAAPAGLPEARAGYVSDWNTVTLDLIRTGSVPPPVATRVLAMVHAAVFDSVNSVDRAYQPYRVQLDAAPGTSREAAAASAAHSVLRGLFSAKADWLDQQLAASLDALGSSAGVTAGVNLGASVGSAILDIRSGDGSGDLVSYTPGDQPGQWRPTPERFAPALLPQWPGVTPFAIPTVEEFRIAPPPALDSAEYAANLLEVQQLGAADSVVRTADQTHIAQFWAAGAGTVTPPGQWNQIAQLAAAGEGLSLLEEARLFGLLNLSLADAAIACWDCKYFFNLWRPVTAIREADTDGNPLTVADPTWSSLLVTPPFPTYSSGHSTFSGAASEILADFFGRDEFVFTFDGVGGPRSFSSFSEAAAEAGRSRIYGGIHFEFDNQAGLAAGRAIARYVAQTQLVPEPSSLVLTGLGVVALAGLRCRSRRR